MNVGAYNKYVVVISCESGRREGGRGGGGRGAGGREGGGGEGAEVSPCEESDGGKAVACSRSSSCDRCGRGLLPRGLGDDTLRRSRADRP
jgi:hypothetical protein